MADSCRRQSSGDGPQNVILLTLDGVASNSQWVDGGCSSVDDERRLTV